MCRLASEFGTVCERGKLRVNFNLIRWVLTTTSGAKTIIVSAGHVYTLLHQREKREVPKIQLTTTWFFQAAGRFLILSYFGRLILRSEQAAGNYGVARRHVADGL